jgi:formate-dependent nitrite reductase cytochrome c552 subunit
MEKDDFDKPTEITVEDIEKFFEKLMTEEIRPHTCSKCSKEYYGGSYGHHIGECDECWFSRFPKDQVEAFYRSFF